MKHDHSLAKLTDGIVDRLAEKWSRVHRPQPPDAEDAGRAEAVRHRGELLDLISTKITGSSSAAAVPGHEPDSVRLQFDPATDRRAVLLVTIPIQFGAFELSRRAYALLARHVGMTLDGVSHWALAVVDRGMAQPAGYSYDLMSDQIALSALGRNYFRTTEITAEYVALWSSCYYVGETTKPHTLIQELGANYMVIHPRYRLLDDNCQNLVESFVTLLCDGTSINHAKLRDELDKASPRMALAVMLDRLRARVDVQGKDEQSGEVTDVMDAIGQLWRRKL